ncbi:hypothetical protein J2X31_002389 [Flavobacterium arsenatis]|uniref:PKD domain-containing protein n=1 Tax=Flavobacterium arsenatis TaxID=1484332 RepID=A0ABU1TR23_9FLAO|nr:hypothetical protein [Flavobacterium arsenatis]MDR6968366.1 hypothetical protein [Flavobacterium arsenatis]
MKNLKYIFSLFFLTILLSCTGEDDVTSLDGIEAPSNISALFTIKQDNSGRVTIRPNGDGLTSYEVYFGDGTLEPAMIPAGGVAEHIYAEGVYTVKIYGIALNGLKTEFTQQLTVSFLQPTDLDVTITPGASRSVTVTAKANLETFFQVYFGEDPDQTPVDFMEGETVSHIYATAGTYEIKVVALSGGAATTEYTETIVVFDLGPAPDPLLNGADVISLFSNAYDNVPVDTWKTDWSSATLEDLQISGNDTKKYSNLTFVGIETVTSMINATQMTHFHTDIWSNNLTEFRIKLVDFGANAAYGGGDDVEHEIVISNPAQEQWVGIDIPLSAFTGLTTRAHIAQLIYVGAPAGTASVYIDNVYFYKQSAVPTVAAPTPTLPASQVISMFSNAYTNVGVNTWKTDWSSAALEEVQIAGNDTKKYSNLDFVGIETTGANMINATSMTHFHTDIWTGNATTFKIKLVDFGANGAYAGGDDKEHEIVITSPAQNTWLSLDIPLSDFTGLTTRAHIAQLIYAAVPTGSATVYVDNVYFHN